jgi:hypothetical protein
MERAAQTTDTDVHFIMVISFHKTERAARRRTSAPVAMGVLGHTQSPQGINTPASMPQRMRETDDTTAPAADHRPVLHPTSVTDRAVGCSPAHSGPTYPAGRCALEVDRDGDGVTPTLKQPALDAFPESHPLPFLIGGGLLRPALLLLSGLSLPWRALNARALLTLGVLGQH